MTLHVLSRMPRRRRCGFRKMGAHLAAAHPGAPRLRTAVIRPWEETMVDLCRAGIGVAEVGASCVTADAGARSWHRIAGV